MKTNPEEIVSILREEIQGYDTRVRRDETGTVLEVGDGIATVYGLDKAVYGELVELDKLRRALCRLHRKKDIQFDLRVDPELLGGFTLDIEGVTYDKSVRGALRRLGRQLEERRMA